jgi:hypothetical protein
MLTAGLIDRAIDRWEGRYSALDREEHRRRAGSVLDEAVRDELLRRNPAKDRARRKTVGGQRRSRRSTRGTWPCLTLPLQRLTNAVVAAGSH